MKINAKELIPLDEMNEMWSALTQEERTYLRENVKYHEFKKNESIYREGEMPTHMFCLISGKVKIFKNGVCGRSQIIRMISPSENFAYRAYFAGGIYLTSAAAVERTSAYSVPLNVVREILQSNNKLAMSFIKVLSNDLGITDARVVSLTQKHIRGRLAETLVMLLDTYGFEEDGMTLGGALSREDLACFSNMTTSNAIRTLSNFVSEGIIELDGRKIKLLDEQHLRKISKLG